MTIPDRGGPPPLPRMGRHGERDASIDHNGRSPPLRGANVLGGNPHPCPDVLHHDVPSPATSASLLSNETAPSPRMSGQEDRRERNPDSFAARHDAKRLVDCE